MRTSPSSLATHTVNWDVIGSVGGVLGAVAVIFTLAFLSRRIRTRKALAQRQAMRELLLGDADAWNEWRQEHPEERPDFMNVDFSRADLRETDLHGANLSEADLSGANLHWVILQGTNLRRADMRMADLREAYLGGARLIQANLEGAISITDGGVPEARTLLLGNQGHEVQVDERPCPWLHRGEPGQSTRQRPTPNGAPRPYTADTLRRTFSLSTAPRGISLRNV